MLQVTNNRSLAASKWNSGYRGLKSRLVFILFLFLYKTNLEFITNFSLQKYSINVSRTLSMKMQLEFDNKLVTCLLIKFTFNLSRSTHLIVSLTLNKQDGSRMWINKLNHATVDTLNPVYSFPINARGTIFQKNLLYDESIRIYHFKSSLFGSIFGRHFGYSFHILHDPFYFTYFANLTQKFAEKLLPLFRQKPADTLLGFEVLRVSR